MSRADWAEAEYVYTVNCRTGETARKFSPDIYQPGDRDPAAPSEAELRAEGERR